MSIRVLTVIVETRAKKAFLRPAAPTAKCPVMSRGSHHSDILNMGAEGREIHIVQVWSSYCTPDELVCKLSQRGKHVIAMVITPFLSYPKNKGGAQVGNSYFIVCL